jgi:hypothetical protein
MSIAAIGAAPPPPITPERAEGPGPDHDGDRDDVAAPPPVKAAPTPGTGLLVDITA